MSKRVAAKLGVRTPATLVTNQRGVARARLGRHVVIKPLGPGQFTQTDGTEAVVFAQLVDLEDPAFRDLGATPFLVQEVIEAQHHLRVVTVRSQAWIAQLAAEDRPLDWRSQPEAHSSFVAAGTEFPAVRSLAVTIARELGLGYSSQDWVEDSVTGNHVLLDVNPGGQWLFLPEPMARDVAASIARWLNGG